MRRRIRVKISTLRDNISSEEVGKFSGEICEKILASDEYKSACEIYAYYPLGNEVDVRPVIEAAWRDGKRVALPKVRGDEMDFYEVTGYDDLAEGAFHIMEPLGSGSPVEWESALMLVPGIAFDRSGNRLGHGGGYYDKYLAGKPGIIKLAPAYDFQIVDIVPAEPTDIKMDLIISPDLYLTMSNK